MPRLLAILFSLLVFSVPVVVTEITAAETTPVVSPSVAPSADPIADDVQLFNPNIYALKADGKPVHHMHSPFVEPSSEIAREVISVTWFSALVFLPFLVLPLLLLLYVIFKFRDHGDDRKPATFTGNHTLEVVWTLIPCLALIVVSVPTWFVLERMEAPPIDKKDALTIVVTGKQFAWDYEYKDFYKDPKAEQKKNIAIGQNMGIQDPLVLPLGRTVQLHMTSNDVNHAWWIPAFGVKKDCIIGRYTYAWFTPEALGFYKGQCAELCGAGHGIMIISACVVKPEDFERYLKLQRAKDDTLKVWSVINPGAGAAVDEKALTEAVVGYLAKGDSPDRRYALQFWIASNFATLERVPPPKGTTLAQVFGAPNVAGIPAAILAKRNQLSSILNKQVELPSVLDPITTAGVLP
jgi:cytochrome c oxidase subunit II